MKFTEDNEIGKLIGEAQSIEELNRLCRIYQIIIKRLFKKLDSIWIINAKVDKIYSEIVKDNKNGNN